MPESIRLRSSADDRNRRSCRKRTGRKRSGSLVSFAATVEASGASMRAVSLAYAYVFSASARYAS